MAYPLVKLAKLMLIRPPQLRQSVSPPAYYVRHPVQSGVQAMLRVQNTKTGLQMLDFLTLLPQKVPFPKMHVVTDSVLSAAFGIADKVYKAEARAYRIKERLLTVPPSVSAPNYHSEDENEIVAAVEELLRTCKYRHGDPLLPDTLLDYHTRRLDWTPHNLQEGWAARSKRWMKAWRVLCVWQKWESDSASWRELLEHVDERFSAMEGPDIETEIDNLRQLCHRTLGLRRTKSQGT